MPYHLKELKECLDSLPYSEQAARRGAVGEATAEARGTGV
jgi:hypothetical protein